MSFSGEVKNELCMNQNLNKCCKKAELYGLGLFGCFFDERSIYLKSENKKIGELFAQLSAERLGLIAEVNSYYRNKKKLAYCAKLCYDSDNFKFKEVFGHKPYELQLQINRANFEDDCCVAAFIKGAFLACGTVTDPQSDYHVEFKTKYLRLSNQFCALINDVEQLNIKPGITNKKGYFLVYIKGADAIVDLLTYMGAHNSAMNFMQVKMLKEMRNNINRTTNFEAANIGRTAKASVKQLNAINLIKEKKGLDFLEEPLRYTAKVRFENPESSLSELCKLIGGVSKSGVNHRLNKIVEIAQKLK